MPIYGARGGFLSTADWEDLADKVILGDGYGWPGDPRMRLEIGVLKTNGKEGHRLEVWRHNEDGSDTRIAHWLPREQHMVCYELSRMRLDSPGHESTEERIDAHNAALEAKRSDEFAEVYGDMLEYGTALFHDREWGKSQFSMAGLADVKKRISS